MSDESSESDPRIQFDSLVPLARRFAAEGRSVGDLMRAIYSVDLPAEIYAFDRAVEDGLDLPLDRTFHPWQLFAAFDPTRSVRGADSWAREQEENAFAKKPKFIPLMKLGAGDAVHDRYVIGYDIDELLQGRATIFGHDGDIGTDDVPLERLEDSLFAVLHEWISDHHRMLREQYESPANRGFGSLRSEDVKEAQELEDAIVSLRREAWGV